MKLREGQSFLSIYYEPSVVEVATGGSDPFSAADGWNGEAARLGQIATPEPIANLMAEWVMSVQPTTVLDPAAGLGGLLSACRRLNKRTTLVGVELDSDTQHRAITTAPPGTKLILADYLQSDAGIFEGIIANPPYVKAQRLAYSEGTWRSLEERFGTKLDRLTNLYALFLLKIWEDLAPGGRAAVLLPAEFLNANFGVEIKERLVRSIHPTAILVFSPSLNLFADALTTSAIVLLEKRRPTAGLGWLKRMDSLEEAETFVRALCAGNEASVAAECFALASLNPGEKWLNRLLNRTSAVEPGIFTHRVGDYFDCRRGIATGANEYFCLTQSDMRSHGLSENHVSPCITKATDATGLVFSSSKFDLLTKQNRRCYLLNPSHHSDTLKRYLEIGLKQGVHLRHLPSHRSVWYLPESRAPADIWAAVFSRENAKFILNTSGARNLTCFHGLYAKPGHRNLAPLMTLYLNSSLGRRAFAEVNRFYGDGLNKLEPKDVEAMPCPPMPALSESDSIHLEMTLSSLEKLCADERLSHIDELLDQHLASVTPPAAPSSSAQHSAQSPRLSGQRKRRVVPI